MRTIIYSLCVAAILATASAAENQLTREEKAEGWELLFDGNAALAQRIE